MRSNKSSTRMRRTSSAGAVASEKKKTVGKAVDKLAIPGAPTLLSRASTLSEQRARTPSPRGSLATPRSPKPEKSTTLGLLGLDGLVDGLVEGLWSKGASPRLPPQQKLDVAEEITVASGEAHLDLLGGACWTGHDLSSGYPGQESRASLKRSRFSGAACFLTRVSFSYRYVVGFSGGDLDVGPGPEFKIVVCDAKTGERLHTVYASPSFKPRPYNWDREEGGDPRNYSPPQTVVVSRLLIPMDAPVELQILFANGKRNVHLQGASGEGCDLDVRMLVKSQEAINLKEYDGELLKETESGQRSRAQLRPGASSSEYGKTEAACSSNTALPHYWKASSIPKQGCDRVDLKGAEAIELFQRLIDETWIQKSTRDRKGVMPRRLQVKKVQRIESMLLWNRFAHRRNQIKASRGTCTPVELLERMADADGRVGRVRTQGICESAPEIMGPCMADVCEHYLFHGTSPMGALGIMKTGFDLSRAGIVTGAMFGPGAYFAECSSKFDEYAREDELSGMCAVLVCRVICGEMHRALRALPPDSMVLQDTRYDGVLGDREARVGTYREFVVFAQEQIYPEYLVLYDREFEEFEPIAIQIDAKKVTDKE